MTQPAAAPLPRGRRRAVFLDRDGTLHEERDFCRRPEDVAVFAGVPEALRALRAAGFALVVVTNQSGIARGYLDEATLARIHAELQRQVGGLIDAFFHCPHHPVAGTGPYTRACRCRKPAPGLIQRAIEVLDLSAAGSWVIGDSARDLLAAPAALGRVLVRTGKPVPAERAELECSGRAPDAITADLAEAAAFVLASAPPV